MMTIYNDGIHDISNDKYHASKGFSRSQLLDMDITPYHFWYNHISGLAQQEQPTPALNVGSAFHTLLLEPHKFEQGFIVQPKMDRRTTKGKEEYAQFLLQAQGKTILTQDECHLASEMARMARKDETVMMLLEDSVFEQAIYWTDIETGLQFKVKPDVWSARMVVDLKSTAGSQRSFQYSALDHGYFLQAGMTYEACKAIEQPIDMFVIIASEKTAPYVPQVYKMDDDALQFGIDQFTKLKRKLKSCLDSNEWPAYEIKELSVPRFALNTIEEVA